MFFGCINVLCPVKRAVMRIVGASDSVMIMNQLGNAVNTECITARCRAPSVSSSAVAT